MTTPKAPRKVAQDEPLASEADAVAGEGTDVRDGQIVAVHDGVFEYDDETRTCRVRSARKPVAGTRRKRGETAPGDADLRETASRSKRSTSRDSARLTKRKGRGDQGTWM